MKRIVPLLLTVLLLAGCIGVPSTARAEDPAPTPEPGPQGPFLEYSFYDQPHWQELTSGVMFEADLDHDGAAEPISFTLRPNDEWATAIAWGESVVMLESDGFVRAAVLDLDPASPFYNLLVVVDYGSDSYGTVELHPENGRLVKGAEVFGDSFWEDGALWFYEMTDFLGTAFGKRTYSGDDLHPDSQWLTMTNIPTAEELTTEREDLIEFGVLLHTIRPVPCTIAAQPGLIPADTYIYRLRFMGNDALAEVCLADGTVAQIACTVGEHGWPYLIDGVDQIDCFDNLFFAD